MFGLLSVVFIVMFVLVGVGFLRHARTANRIFDLAHRELDRRHAELERPAEVECAHCGSRVPHARDCPNCGAGLETQSTRSAESSGAASGRNETPQ
jgi:hypothetical protein